ncbi:MAG: PQQ-binding-like beta-propeller repeat protein [Planctomycetota bacterium]
MNSSKHVLPALLAFSVIVNSSIACGEDPVWTGWLGAERDGQVTGFAPPQNWPEELELQWEQEVGDGYAAPLVRDGVVFVHSRIGDEEALTALLLETGEIQWQKKKAVPFKVGGGGEWHGAGPKAAPFLHQNRIFTMSINGVLTAWDANTGSELWEVDRSSEFEGLRTPYWGATASPIAQDNQVYVHFGNDDDGFLEALDTATGESIWRAKQRVGAAYSSPLILKIQDVPQLVEWNHRGLAAHDLDTGQQLWFYEFPHEGTNQNMPTPNFSGGRIFIGGENRGVRCVEPMLNDGAWSVQELWNQKRIAFDMSTAVANGELLFGFSHYNSSQLCCLDLATGEVRWKGPGRAGQNATFLAWGNLVAALLDDGSLQFIEATGGSYLERAEYQVSERPTWAAPVILPSGILIKDRTHLLYRQLP